MALFTKTPEIALHIYMTDQKSIRVDKKKKGLHFCKSLWFERNENEGIENERDNSEIEWW